MELIDLFEQYPLVSIIVLNYNGEKYLNNCIRTVLENKYPRFEVILVDNASTDDSIQPIKDQYSADPRLHIIVNKANLGFSGGNNLGLEYSNGKYIVFLNNDTTVEPDWLIHLVRALEQDSTIGIAQSLIYAMDKKSVLSAGWVYSDYLIRKYALCADKPANLQLKPVFDVSFVCGASMIIRREILEAMGAFEPSIPFFYDDTLLTLKTRLYGKRAVTVTASKMCHASGATNVWKMHFTTLNLQKANDILMFDVFQKPSDLVKAAFFSVANAVINIVFNLRKRNAAVVHGNIDAFIWTVLHFPFVWQNRLNHWSKSAVSSEKLKQEFVRLNLPSAFYLLPSKTSTELLSCALQDYENQLSKQN